MSLVSLTNISSTLETCESPDFAVPANTSVNASNGAGPLAQQCSAALYRYAAGDYCSVGNNNNVAKVFCSTSAAPTGAYCSTNVGNLSGPVTCSVYGAAFGVALLLAASE